ncbi:MAG: hypothetical protein IT210_07580 [Armatimonadetes bacterium]|nr:hypothetical protein [Armatimonadota bacterium]
MVGIQQCERQTALCRDYHCIYSFESGIAYTFDRYAGIDRPRTVSDAILSRETDFLECFLEAARQSGIPYLFSCAFEFNGVWPEMAAINRQFMGYLVRRSRAGRIAFTHASAAADFYRKHYRRMPESLLYLSDVFAGLTQGGKPINYPDTLEIENDRMKAIFRKRESLPYVWYDYTVPWRYPDWGNEAIPRKPDGYIVSDTEDRFKATPAIVDTRPFEVAVAVQDGADSARVRITVEAKAPRPALPLALWDLPREYSRRESDYSVQGATRFIPAQAPCTGNLCGILITDIKAGANTILLTVRTRPRSPKTMDFASGKEIMAKIFERDGSATAYLFATGPSPGTLRLDLPEGEAVSLYPSDSDEPVALKGSCSIRIEPGKCQRVFGLTSEKLMRYCKTVRPVVWDTAKALPGRPSIP